MNSTEASLKKLKACRAQCKSKITRFQTFLDSVNVDRLGELESRFADILPLLREFEDIQSQIEELDANEGNGEYWNDFENNYYFVIGKAKQIIKEFNGFESTSDSTNLNLNNQIKPNVKLPVMQLPTFDGSYEQWEYFKDMFVALVHSDTTIDNVRKFYYLSNSLTGAAAKVIQSLPISNDNYGIAWQLLKDRFEDKEIIIRNHIKSIVDMKNVSSDIKYSLRELTDDLQIHLRSLESLGEPIKQWSSILNYLIWKKLDRDTQVDWEEYVVTKKLKQPEYTVLLEFLIERCKFLEKRDKSDIVKNRVYENYNQNKSFDNRFKHKINSQSKKQLVSNFTVNRSVICSYCKDAHYIYFCDKFKNLPVSTKIAEAKTLSLCSNCLRNNHHINECISQGCKKCGKKHNTLLHVERLKQSSEDARDLSIKQGIIASKSDIPAQEKEIENDLTVSHFCQNQTQQILLSTASLLIMDNRGGWQVCRALLDSGSQPNFITKRLAEQLHLKTNRAYTPVTGVGKSTTNTIESVNTQIKSRHENFNARLTFLVLEKITQNLPLTKFDKTILKLPKDILLADADFNECEKIDLLLGAEIFYDLLKSDQIKLGVGLPNLQSTVLGWIVSGPISHKIEIQRDITCNLAVSNDINFDLENFWKIEEIQSKSNIDSGYEICENIFSSSIQQNKTGRFIVDLPFKNNTEILGESLNNAVKRLHSMERKFTNNPDFKLKYKEFMNEYIALGHMSKIGNSETLNSNQNIFYLPHHGVLNENSSTTKLRVVFDGSCKSSNGSSLNDMLLVGPKVQDDLFEIIMRFRKHNYVITADIEKMYRQILINEDQRDYQRIVWRDSPDVPISHFKLNTVTYGVCSSAFLSTRCLKQISIEQANNYRSASKVIATDFYVDDLLTGARTINDAKLLKSQLQEILSKYGFTLRKWSANELNILGRIDFDDEDNYQIANNEGRKTLGIWWEASSDIFRFHTNLLDNSNNVITKRSILASISRLFDPLGLLAPIIISAKLLIQQLWQLKINWDAQLPSEIVNRWLQYIMHFSAISNISIPRQSLHREYQQVELHGFCDASEKAYGACFYIKSIPRNERPKIMLLCAKSRVAPLKSISLPRLELCGAVLLANLYDKVIQAIQLKFNEIYFWTDSSIVLGWLRSPPSTWKVFVANRVSEIQSLTEISQWAHVSSHDNPADLISRGVSPEKLANSDIWWQGPQWLCLTKEFWPIPKIDCSKPIPDKRKTKLITLTISLQDFSIFDRYSSWWKLKRVIAWCFRFINNCKVTTVNRNRTSLTIEETSTAERILVRLAQLETFEEEYNSLKKNNMISKKSKLRSLNPFLDFEGLIRVGGRIQKSTLPDRSKHQIILPSKHRLTILIIQSEHYRQLHAGIQQILNSLREKFWIIDGRTVIRNVLRKCVVCFRVNPVNINCQMGNLPRDRIIQNRPFYISGVDFAGPFLIKDGKLRNRVIIKAYLCLFICFTTKAVHLEVVSDLSCEAFLCALKRFISRRGICKTIYSDNATNFVGARNKIKSLKVDNFLAENQIEWKFIPPHSPHQGGLWESSIKLAKYHTKRVIGQAHLTFEDLQTIFCQVEAIINSRPITPLSSDPTDLTALTPGHFLIGCPLLTLPETDVTEIPTNRLKHYQRLQQIVQHFWKRWSREYLLNLQPRTKWHQPNEPGLKIEDLVVLIDENAPPLAWKLGRIEVLYAGSDGISRVALVKTATGSIKRAVQKLCRLPIETHSVPRPAACCIVSV